MKVSELKSEIENELTDHIIPFWEGLRDDEYGGYYGWLDFDLNLNKKAEKGCILNSRITWFFSRAYLLLGDKKLLDEAKHGYEFLRDKCIDREYGGVFWSLNYDGTLKDTTKHTYNQAFSIYALSTYYDASKDEEALKTAMELFELIEKKCMDNVGYLEAFTREFVLEENDKLSENGVIADKTMNTLLHVLEAYTELYRVSKNQQVKNRLLWMTDVFGNKIYNPVLKRQEVFFDRNYNSIINLYSYGHDIETSWLMDRCTEVLDDASVKERMDNITKELVKKTYETAYDGHSVANECDRGVVNENRVWWIQAESMVGFYNAYTKDTDRREYLDAVFNIWEYTKKYIIDDREGSEWFWYVRHDGTPVKTEPIVEPWKCPYHNGRMCIEMIERIG